MSRTICIVAIFALWILMIMSATWNTRIDGYVTRIETACAETRRND